MIEYPRDINMRSGKLVIILLFMALSSLWAARDELVPQKVAVLQFTLKNVPEELSFLGKSIPQQIEIALDKTGTVLVIREYLWSKVYEVDKIPATVSEAVSFGANANIDAVIAGSLSFRSNSVLVKASVIETAKEKRIAVKQTVIENAGGNIPDLKVFLAELATEVSQLLPQKDPKVLIKEKKIIKKKYLDIETIRHQFSIEAGYVFGTGEWNSGPAEGVDYLILDDFLMNEGGFGDTNQGQLNAHGFRLAVGYKFKRFEIVPNFSMLFGQDNFRGMRFGSEFHIDIFRRMFTLISTYEMQINSVERTSWLDSSTTVASYMDGHRIMLGFMIRPTDLFQFGMKMGPVVGTWADVDDVVIPKNNGYNNFSAGFMYAFNFTDHITVNMLFEIFGNGIESIYPEPMGDGTREFSTGVSLGIFMISLKYRFKWGQDK